MQIIDRIYSDYLMPSRLSEYEVLLKQSIEAGFQHLSMVQFYEKIQSKELDPAEKYLIIRHDIDTDINTAKLFFAIEQYYRVKTTYFFRLITIDELFMRKIHESGSEVGYHYEEIATYCKSNHLRSREEALQHFSEIGELFLKNLSQFEYQTHIKIYNVAAHGDFVNRKLDILNQEILQDEELRRRAGILAEAYDSIYMKNCDVYLSDRPYPQFYYPVSPFEAMQKYRIIYMLSHPRHWGSNLMENLKADRIRLVESILW
jgi:hypothetical protein